MISDDAFYLKSIEEIIGSFLLYLFLVMEQTDTGKCHYHVVFITAFDHQIIADRSARLCNVGNTALVRALNVICKREECIGSQCHTAGFSVKDLSQLPSPMTSMYSSPIYTSIALSRSARVIPSLNGRFSTCGL